MTLSEFLVVMVLLGVVLGTAYAGMQGLQRGAAAADRDNEFARQITYPMFQLEKILVQNRSIVTGEPYRIIILSDKNLDGAYERHTISATTNGKIHILSENLNNTGGAVATTLDKYITDRNSNQAASMPLFRYYTRQGTEVTSTPDIPSQAESLVISIISRNAGRSIVDTRAINFRNRD